LKTEADIRYALSFFAIASLLAAAVALAELASGRLFYSGLQFIYDVRWQLTLELFRGSLIRSQAMTPQPILLALLLTFGLAAWALLKGAQWRKPGVWVVMLIFAAAIASTGSRGPLLGLFLFGLCLLLLRVASARAFGLTLAGLGVSFALVKIFGWDDQIMRLLQAMFGRGEADTDSIDYRRALFDTGLELLKQQPWWGVSNYAAQMQNLRQGEGIIDLVNTYIAVALEVGLVGLTFFLWPYLLAMRLLALRLAPLRSGHRAVMGSFAPAWLALMASLMFTLFSTSLWGVLEFLLVIFLGLTAAWVNCMPSAEPGAPDRLDPP
jgi:O-antigen ligase